MTFRLLLSAIGIWLLTAAAFAGQDPYRVSLLAGNFDGEAWQAGVLVELDPGWKTYWRMPGEAGIAPEFSWTSSSPADVTVGFPTPRRYVDASGDTVGYETEVLFPVTVKASGETDLDLGLELFFGVCKDICIPARAQASVRLQAMTQDPAGAARVWAAFAGLPSEGDAVRGVALAGEGGKPALELTFRTPVDDVFVQTSSPAYFRAPVFSGDGLTAKLPIDNLAEATKLSGQVLRLTYRRGDKGYQQAVSVK